MANIRLMRVTFRATAIVERTVTVNCLPEEAEAKAHKHLLYIDGMMGGPDCWNAITLTSQPEVYSLPAAQELFGTRQGKNKAVNGIGIGLQRTAGDLPAPSTLVPKDNTVPEKAAESDDV